MMAAFRFITGSYTEETLFPGSKGDGIQVWQVDSTNGGISLISTCPAIANPSWIAVHPNGRLIAATSEQVHGKSRIALFAVSEEGDLDLLDSIPAGDATCHAAFSPDGQLLASAAYMAGEVQLMMVGEKGFSGAP